MQGICADGVDVAGVGGNDKVVRYLIGFDDIPLAGYCYVDGELRLAEGLQSEALCSIFGVIYRDRDVFDRHGLPGASTTATTSHHNGGEQRNTSKICCVEEIAYLQFFFLFHFFMPFIILLKVPSPVVNLLSGLSMR